MTTYNILFRFSDRVSQWSENEIYAILGEPDTEPLVTCDHSDPGPCAPRELVAPVDDNYLCSSSFLREEILVTDFGQSFFLDEKPTDYQPATAIHYAPPEMRFENKISQASDIWSLACALFEIRAGFELFESFLGTTHVMIQTIETLGKLPDPWWNAFEHRRTWFESNGDPRPLEIQRQEGIRPVAVKSSIKEKLESIGVGEDPPTGNEGPMIEKTGTRLDEREIVLLDDLLQKMLRYSPEDRITIQEVLQHPWFRYSSD